jgi:hypothetical protein
MIIRINSILCQYLHVYFILHDLYEYFVLCYYAYEGLSIVTFVRDSLYPEGI